MKQLLEQYATYSTWANRVLTDSILKLERSLYDQYVPSSFPSLYKTIFHMWDAEVIWWHRLQPVERKISDSNSQHEMQALIEKLLKSNKDWEDWVLAASEEDLGRSLSYKSLKGEPFHQPICELLVHLFNHGTYHRGQLVTIMRNLGVETIPGTDFVKFTRIR